MTHGPPFPPVIPPKEPLSGLEGRADLVVLRGTNGDDKDFIGCSRS